MLDEISLRIIENLGYIKILFRKLYVYCIISYIIILCLKKKKKSIAS